MIGCPKCGSSNRKGSKYCSNCGQRLDIECGLICPACHTLNASDSTYCSSCGNTLTPSPTDDGTNREALENNSESAEAPTSAHRKLPQWLYEHPAVGRNASGGPPVSAPPPMDIPTTRRSKYLNGLHEVLPSADAWVSSSQARTTGMPASTAAGRMNDVKPDRQGGCLPLILAIFLATAGLGLCRAL